MANEAKTRAKLAIPTLEQFQSVLQTVTTVGTNATKVPASALAYRKAIIIQNVHASNIVYIGSSTVTADTAATGGFQLGPLDAVAITLDGSVDMYAIASGANTPVVTIEMA